MAAAPAGRSISIWLSVCCAMIFAMIVLGGLTRLTGSGLSMVQWQPVTGLLPPIGEAQWAEIFALYQKTPEFQRVNFWMTVADFRQIFWLEYIHRIWGRLIGVVFALPLVYFLIRGRIGRALGVRLGAAFLLGAAQGALGWYMVRSGLVDRPEVSHYRLAAHLSLAVALYAYLLWLALGPRPTRGAPAPLGVHTFAVLAGIALTIVWGAFVAGLDAGHIYPSFPLMGGVLFPPELFSLKPWWADLTGNAVTVQFVHRWLALAVAARSACWRSWP